MIILLFVLISRAEGSTPEVFGLTLHIVVSPSMEPDIKVGDFVVSKKVPINEIEINDDVIFRSTNSDSLGMPIIHRVVSITVKDDGAIELTTKGINNQTTDEQPVKQILGKKIWSSTGIGKMSKFFTDAQRLLIIIVFIALAVICAKFSIRIYAKYKKNCEESEKKNRLLEEVKAELADELKQFLAKDLSDDSQNINLVDNDNENNNELVVKPFIDEPNTDSNLDSETIDIKQFENLNKDDK
jgi:signal peptidase